MQTVNGRYAFADYMQAVVNAGAYAQSNGTRVSSPGISYEVANSTAALPSAKGYASVRLLSTMLHSTCAPKFAKHHSRPSSGCPCALPGFWRGQLEMLHKQTAHEGNSPIVVGMDPAAGVPAGFLELCRERCMR